MDNILRHVFVQWLASKGALNDWMDNVLNPLEINNDNNISECPTARLVIRLFVWGRGARDKHNWAELHQEWLGIYNILKNK